MTSELLSDQQPRPGRPERLIYRHGPDIAGLATILAVGVVGCGVVSRPPDAGPTPTPSVADVPSPTPEGGATYERVKLSPEAQVVLQRSAVKAAMGALRAYRTLEQGADPSYDVVGTERGDYGMGVTALDIDGSPGGSYVARTKTIGFDESPDGRNLTVTVTQQT